LNLSLVPDLTMRGAPSPYAPPPARTVGRLAGLIAEIAAAPDRWWHLVRFDGVPVRLDDGVWLAAWPPDHRAAPGADVLIVLAGELTAAARAVRAGRVHVRGGGRPWELTNPGPGYAITLHATVSAGDRPAHAQEAEAGEDGGQRVRPAGEMDHGDAQEQGGGEHGPRLEAMPVHA
jgi:hypothetical protein